MRTTFPSILGLGAAVALASAIAVPAAAQTMDTTGPHSSYCGSWQAGTWTPNGNCTDETTTTTTVTTSQNGGPPPAMAQAGPARMMERINGTIISVKGHLVTLQQSTRTIVVNDSPALERGATGRVAVGRQVEAHGYWDAGTFMVTRMD